jgi:hypothetical protein
MDEHGNIHGLRLKVLAPREGEQPRGQGAAPIGVGERAGGDTNDFCLLKAKMIEEPFL